jgi:pimeloyl-ACP methyl ester carboxylesterase
MDLNYHRAGSGDPLVLIHGIGSRWQMWEPVLPLLEARHDVIALDVPGFGASPPPPPGTPPGVPSLAALIRQFLDDLGLERPHVAGNSMGGWISLELAKQGRVRSATALSPAGFHTRREAAYERAVLWTTVRAARLLDPFVDRIAAFKLGRKLAFGAFFAHPERLTPVEAADSTRALAGAPWFDEMLPALASDRFRDGGSMAVPVTIAWGEKDRLLLPRQAPRAARAVRGARLVVLRGCGHVPTYDDPDQVASVMLEGSGGS